MLAQLRWLRTHHGLRPELQVTLRRGVESNSCNEGDGMHIRNSFKFTALLALRFFSQEFHIRFKNENSYYARDSIILNADNIKYI